MKLWVKIIIALFLGVALGSFLSQVYGDSGEIFAETYLKPLGDIFLNMISMLIVLLIFSSMTIGITSIHDPQKLGRVGLKTLIFYVSTTAIAISFGVACAYIIKPGVGIGLEGTEAIHHEQLPDLGSILLAIVPSNPIHAMAKAKPDVLQIIVFSLFLGVSINFAGEKGRPLLELLESIADVMYRLTSIVMEFAPVGVFGIMTYVAAKFGPGVLKDLASFLLCNWIACAIQVLLIFGGILWMAKLSPVRFIRGMGDAIVFAFSTNSSSATLPVSLHCIQENLGVSKNISSFVLPLGATVNMNGTGIFQGVAAVFIAQAYGIDLSTGDLVKVVVTGVLSAIGSAGIPGTGLAMLSVVLSSVGIPPEGILLIAGVDRIREMVSTVVNILGDAVVALYVAKSEGELDETQYNHTELVELEEAEI